MQKHKSELFLETEEGVATPLSLVHVEEEFNTTPSLYQGDGVAQAKEQGNLVSLARLKYNFVQEANLPTRSGEFSLTGENVSLFPERPKAHPYAKGLMNDFTTTISHQGSPLHIKATYVSLKQNGGGVIAQSQEQNNPPDAAVAGDSSQKEGNPSERSPPEKVSHPGNHIEAAVNRLPTSKAREETCDREASSGGCDSAENHLSPVPVIHPQASLTGHCTCSKCSHPFECSSVSLAAQKVKAANKWVKLAGEVAEKPFHCPDCGKGFLHRSSIPRHRRLHNKESSSPDSEKEMSNPGTNSGASFTIKPPAIKPQRLPGADQPFKCLFCNKSYGQRYHLKRHDRQKHQVAQ